ncbi:ribonucleases P/MRP protein subunit POP1-domain-containing protein [Phyllosticta capitalensis]|uniref:ribonucleases P/MRP protein subunit POP1-domain-containing protein n=1 Tax=Phyllosticta capitalensis TaxID=121624 RepID=UPI0031309FCE
MADKRKQPPGAQPNAKNGRQNKRARTRDARQIAAQASGTAFKNGEIDVDKFVKARQFEIKALEDGMRNARKGLSTRAFQGVPRELRRRTASHNVKKVPKRLRSRAAREMVEDNTPTVQSRRRKPSGHMRLRLDNVKRLQILSAKAKAKKTKMESGAGAEEDAAESSDKIQTRKARVKTQHLKNPPTPPARYRKRQLNKQWLPTHMFHTKRAHMTPPKEPLWRFAIPMAPTLKCYRPSHRAAVTRGAIAWDMSYMATIGLRGREENIQKLLKDLGVDSEGLRQMRGQKWRNGTRAWQGWLSEKTSTTQRPIAPVTIIWQSVSTQDVDMKDADASEKSSKRSLFVRVHPSAFMQLWKHIRKLSPPVSVEDLRFEIGSIEITGPGATEALNGILEPVSQLDAEGSPGAIWKQLRLLNNLGHLPPGALLGFEVSDPRLHHPPQTATPSLTKDSHSRLLQTLAEWPVDRTQAGPAIFDRSLRLAAQRSLPSQKSINRRKTAAKPGAYPEARPTDPKIPLLLFASRGAGASAGTWTVLLPWRCVSAVWNSLMYYPLSTGGNVRFGGLDQKRQLAFEAGVPCFPGDFPGTDAGMKWNEAETLQRKADWEKRPKAKRVAWESVRLDKDRKGEVGRGWACDWEFLASNSAEASKPGLCQLSSQAASAALAAESPTLPNHQIALFNIKLTIVARGTPTTCARIYRLPQDQDLRRKWLSLLPDPKSKNKQQKKAAQRNRPGAGASPHDVEAYLASTLIDPSNDPFQAGSGDYPPVPDADDLIGFITSGNYNLGEGRATGVGSLSLERILEGWKTSDTLERTLCIVRNAGESVGRLAKWEFTQSEA